jgi:hypothetical protein
METIYTLTARKRVTIGVLIALLSILAALIVYDLFFKNDFFFLVVEIMAFGMSVDYLMRYYSAYSSIAFGPEALVLSRKGKTVELPYDSITSILEVKNGFIAIAGEGKDRYVVHAEHNRSMSEDAPERTSNAIRAGILEASGREIGIRYA